MQYNLLSAVVHATPPNPFECGGACNATNPFECGGACNTADPWETLTLRLSTLLGINGGGPSIEPGQVGSS
jgi:hypothetical protein